MKRLNCYSHLDFDNLCRTNGWDDNNIPEDSAFISIIGTKECREEYEVHWFKEDHDNVLNLEFDDISIEELTWNECKFTGITKEQAVRCVNFIDNNIGRNFYIHCKAGKSRSQGVVRFILDMYKEDYETRKNNPCVFPIYMY